METATSQLIQDQFGTAGLRMFNLLNEGKPPQKMEEAQIFSTCMVPPQEGRVILNDMVRRGIVQWQEIPKNATLPIISSYWLFYTDPRRLQSVLLWNVTRSILNLRVRFRIEMQRGAPLESRRDSLTKVERLRLKAGRRSEDILERSFLVMSTALFVFRSH